MRRREREPLSIKQDLGDLPETPVQLLSASHGPMSWLAAGRHEPSALLRNASADRASRVSGHREDSAPCLNKCSGATGPENPLALEVLLFFFFFYLKAIVT